MLVRLGIATIGYKMPVIYNGKANIFIASYSGWLFGWYLGTALIIAVALKGIAEKRHILIYPYIVVVVTEMVIIVGLTIYYVFAVGPLLKDISVIGVIRNDKFVFSDMSD
ncbi:hypothetical protein FQR65_LT11580 [Abscondita terminalis]|nr:hypothetical protein FQR65_LT11580 [Abscondita terminalis]